MIFELYVMVMIFGIITLCYSLFYRDKENYTHIISGGFSAITFIILGMQAYEGIEFQHVVETATIDGGVVNASVEIVSLTTYQYGWLGGLIVIIGVMAALYTIVMALNENKDLIDQTEGNEIYSREKGI